MDTVEIDEHTLPQINEELYYNLVVEFPVILADRYRGVKEFPIISGSYRAAVTPSQKITGILSGQLHKMAQLFIDHGYALRNAYIQGEHFEQNDILVLKLFEDTKKEYKKSGKPKKIILVYSIIQQGPYIRDVLQRVIWDGSFDPTLKAKSTPVKNESRHNTST